MHPRVVAEKTAKAVTEIDKSVAALAKHFKLDIQSLPNVRRFDTEQGRAMQLEHLADTLKQIAVATKSAKESDFEVTDEKEENQKAEEKEVTESAAKVEFVEEEVEIVEKPSKKKGKSK